MTEVRYDDLEELPLSDEVKRALLAREGRMGAALDCVLAYERGRFEESTLEGLTAEMLDAANMEEVITGNKQQKHKKKLNEFIEEPEEPVRFEDEDEEKND